MRTFSATKFFTLEDDHLVAWIGDLDVAELEDYLNEPGGAADNEPHSLFSADLGRFYDHDFIYAQASDAPTTIRSLANENGIDDELLIQELETRFGTQAHAKCFVILWNAKTIEGAPNVFAKGRLSCVGCWPHTAPLGG